MFYILLFKEFYEFFRLLVKSPFHSQFHTEETSGTLSCYQVVLHQSVDCRVVRQSTDKELFTWHFLCIGLVESLFVILITIDPYLTHPMWIAKENNVYTVCHVNNLVRLLKGFATMFLDMLRHFVCKCHR